MHRGLNYHPKESGEATQTSPPELGPSAGFAPVSVTHPYGKLSRGPPQLDALLNRPVSRGNPCLSRCQTHPRGKSDGSKTNVRKNGAVGLVHSRPGAAFIPLSMGISLFPTQGLGFVASSGRCFRVSVLSIIFPLETQFPHVECGSNHSSCPRTPFPFCDPL